jgi:hypothetical protein
MEAWFLGAGITLCLFSLWVLIRKDWVRLRSVSRTAVAEVIGHRMSSDNDGISYAAVMRFSADGQAHEVVDALLHANPQPPVGTKITVHYPYTRPDLARISRPWTWAFVYAVLLFTLAMLIARWLDWLPTPSG